MKVFLAALLAITLTACERNEPENIYEPGGKFAQRLDARGRRHLVYGRDGEILAKFRDRDDFLKVYNADMQPVGELELKQIRAVRQGLEPEVLNQVSDGVFELPGRFRVETVEHGWAVFDAKARKLGYFEWKDDRLALRDDYASAPRLYAQVGSASARTPTGEATLKVVPPYAIDALLPFALESEALDALDKLALGRWLMSQRPGAAASPDPAQAD